MDVEHDTGKAFGNTPYYTCDRQARSEHSPSLYVCAI